MNALGKILGFIVICGVLGAAGFFVYYSLNIYHSNGHVACTGSSVAKQTDVAIHVVRQWFGREQNLYNTCPGSSS